MFYKIVDVPAELGSKKVNIYGQLNKTFDDSIPIQNTKFKPSSVYSTTKITTMGV